MSARATHDVVQIKNPKSGHYIKIDRSVGKIIGSKSSPGPYKGIPVARKSAARMSGAK